MDCTTETYSWPSSVNVANFVTVRPQLREEVKLRSMNFKIWKEQMMCLVESQDVAGFINGEIEKPQTDEQKLWKRSDRLVKGWILGSIGADVLPEVCWLETARKVWLELERIFNPISEIQPLSSYTRRDFTQYLPLYKAAITGDWETACTLFFQNNIWESEACITLQQETALHVAVQSERANDFVRNLVRIMSLEALALRDCIGYTALHKAAMIGNTGAARAMLEKYPDLVYMLDNTNISPVSLAARSRQKNTLTYLISVYESHTEHSPVEGLLGIDFFLEVIASEFLDVALDLIKKYPHLSRVRSTIWDRCALSFVAGMESVFLSRESFSWWENLIYRSFPLKQQVSISTSVSSKKSSTSFQIINGGK